MEKIFICTIKKYYKHDIKCFESVLISFESEKILLKLKSLYKIDFIKDEKYHFPFFTDGGFRYSGSDNLFNYEFICVIENIL